MYGSKSWVRHKKNKSRIDAVEMRSLRSMSGVSQKDSRGNRDVGERCGLKEDVLTRVERGGPRGTRAKHDAVAGAGASRGTGYGGCRVLPYSRRPRRARAVSAIRRTASSYRAGQERTATNRVLASRSGDLKESSRDNGRKAPDFVTSKYLPNDT
ncbi:hypothetical protein EVAR_38626_1 [Eumeta japonica]|uniref:Uncharacterized protein n=1 Tax=Eumeta variegata TaxID=151549 RepID=A0A4C1XYU0_EUMVA|nr:hypothetical protein EVAR_38626_1 [Eumeta japonica]